MQYDYTVFIGRFQPFHNGHLQVCKEALQSSKHLIMLLGSAHSAPTIRNPFSWEDRRETINQALSDEGIANKVTVIPIRDYYYSDSLWVADIQAKVGMIVGPNQTVALAGHQKDASSYYLKLFPKWDYLEIKSETDINSTDIRNIYWGPIKTEDGMKYIQERCPQATRDFLLDFAVVNQDFREEYTYLQEEFAAMKSYKAAWSNAPYAPVFVTTDAVVVCGGHVLLVRRKGQPGKGLLALPGGFINQEEKLEQCCLRELKEETRIKVPLPVLKGCIKDKKVFDHPLRSVRGRTITHAFHIELNESELPKVKGSDDALTAGWFPLSEVAKMMDSMFEDHFAVIESFVGRLI